LSRLAFAVVSWTGSFTASVGAFCTEGAVGAAVAVGASASCLPTLDVAVVSWTGSWTASVGASCAEGAVGASVAVGAFCVAFFSLTPDTVSSNSSS